MHSAEATHIEPLFEAAGWKVERYWEADFALPAAYAHHSSRQGKTRAAFWRLIPPE
jgi:predicted RNA methylase